MNSEIRERVFILQQWWLHDHNYEDVVESFLQHFPNSRPLSRQAILNLNKRFEVTGSVTDLPQSDTIICKLGGDVSTPYSSTLQVLKNNKYDILDPLVEDIHNKCIRMDLEERQALVGRCLRVIDKFIKKMKEVDLLFNQVFNRIDYTGSYFEGLRVGEATEFDLNLILNPKLNLRADTSGSPAGFVSVSVCESCENLPNYCKQWVSDVDGELLMNPTLVGNWLQGVVQRTVVEIKAEWFFFDDCEITLFRKSGPAWTLEIVCLEDPMKTINVDLVPVLEFPSGQWPVTRQSQFDSSYKTWFAVPKPPRGAPNSCDWRLSFPIQETLILTGHEYLKYTLRLVKRTRDQFQFKAIASYYIKTLFLWELEREDKSIWSRSRRGRLFIYMLIRLKEALEMERIPFFWDDECNLIEQVHPETLKNFSGRLRRFLHTIDYMIDNGETEKLENYIEDNLSTPRERKEDLRIYEWPQWNFSEDNISTPQERKEDHRIYKWPQWCTIL